MQYLLEIEGENLWAAFNHLSGIGAKVFGCSEAYFVANPPDHVSLRSLRVLAEASSLAEARDNLARSLEGFDIPTINVREHPGDDPN